MPRRDSLLAPLAVACIAIGTACSDGNGPEPVGDRILTLRAEDGQRSIWEHGPGAPRRVTPDSVHSVLAMARAGDGRLAYVTLPTGSVKARLVEASASGAVLRAMDITQPYTAYEHPLELEYSPDGSRLAWHTATSSGSDSLYVLDAGATAPRGLAVRAPEQTVNAVLTSAPPMRWTPGGRVVFGPAGSLISYHASTGDTVTITSGAGYILDYDFTDDGRLAIVSSVPLLIGMRLRAQRVVGGPLIQVTGSAAANPNAVLWSVDGRHLAMTVADSVFRQGQWERFAVPQLVTPDGSEPAIRANGLAASTFHGWTSDGRLVVRGVSVEPAVPSQEIFAVQFGAGTTNVTRTPAAQELAAIVVR